jgi:RNA polymerase sigma factor (sigma-70 family)
MIRFSEERSEWIARNVLPHEPALRAQIVRWRLPHDLDADDVVQEAYSRFASMQSVEGVRNSKNYLFMVARNFIVSHVRHSRVVSIRSVENLDVLGVAADEPSPETQVSDREQLHRLAEAVSELPEPNRKAFLMRVMAELPHREIAEKLGLSDNAVQKIVAKSARLLLARLGRGGNANHGASSADSNREDAHRHGTARHERGD